MRNLKKVLALVLTLAMMLSVMVMNVGAFTDDKDIQHKEAAAVANAIEVLKGYEDGTYGPEKTLTRAEAATICARMLLTPDKANALKTTEAPFADVEADNWAAGYIAYCASEKIINGVGNNNFDPDGTLTVAQFCKIMLGALGYDAETEGMTGSAWSINTAKLAQKNDLLDEVDSAFDGDCNRDDAAQIILNTLVATLVEYATAGTTVTTSDGTQVTVNGNGATKVDNNVDPNAAGASENIKLDGYQQFAEEYFPDLKQVGANAANENNFGRPGSLTWQNDGDNVYTVSDDANYELVATYTEKATKGDLFKVIGKTTADKVVATPANLEVYVDGDQDANASATYTTTTNYDGLFAKNSTKTADCTGNGVLCEVYKDADNDKVRIVIINTYLAQATDDYDEDKGELAIDNSYLPAGVNGPLSDEDFDIAGYVDEDWLLVTVDAGDIASVQPAETVDGTVDSYSSGNSITADGTVYKLAKTIDASFTATYPNIESDITLILDQYGFVIGTDDVDSDDDYLYVIGTGNGGVKNTTVGVYFTDGTYEEITVKGTTAPASNAWYTYEQNDDGMYELTAVTGADAKTSADTATNDKVEFTTDLKGTNTTVFLVMDKDAYEDGTDCDVYTGYKSVPLVTGANSIKAVLDDGYCTYVFVDANKAGATIKGSSDDSTDYMIIFAADVAVADSNKDSDKNVFYTFESVLLNGEEASVNVIDSKAVDDNNTPANTADDTIALDAGVLYTGLTYDENGYVDGWDAAISNDYAAAVAADEDYSVNDFTDKSGSGGQDDSATVTESNGVLSIGAVNFQMADDAQIFVITSATTAAGDYDDSITAAKLAKDYKTNKLDATVYCALNDDGDVTAMYIVK